MTHHPIWLSLSCLIAIGAAILLWRYRRFAISFFAWIKHSTQTAWGKVPAIDIKKALKVCLWMFTIAIIIGVGIVIVRHFGWPWLFPFIALGVIALLLTQRRYGIAIIFCAIAISAAILTCAISLPIFAQSHQRDDSMKDSTAQQPRAAQEKPPAAKEAESSDTDGSTDAGDTTEVITELQDKLTAQQDELDMYHQRDAAAQANAQSSSVTDNEGGIEKPFAPARPNGSTIKQVYRAPYADATAQTPEIKPTSGDEGILLVRLTRCRYLYAAEIGCEGFVQSKEDPAGHVLYLGDSSGVDDQGDSFSVWVSDGSIRFKGNSYPAPAHLVLGTKQFFSFRFRRPSGIEKIGFILQVAGEDGHWHEYDFQNVPVSIN